MSPSGWSMRACVFLSFALVIGRNVEANSEDENRYGYLRRSLKRRGYECNPELGWYKLSPFRATWPEAKNSCIRDGANLAVINSLNEAEYLKKLLNENSSKHRWNHIAFVGIHDPYKENDWITITDEPLEETGYARWHEGYPDEEINHYCGAIHAKSRHLVNEHCEVELPFFCEVFNGPLCDME